MEGEIHIAHFIDEVPADGSEVQAWGRHVTLIPPFDFGGNLEQVVSLVESGLQKRGRMTLRVGRPDEFDGLSVVTFKQNPEWMEMRAELIAKLGSVGAKFTSQQWLGGDHIPHCVVAKGESLGNLLTVNHLSINQRFAGNKHVLKTIFNGVVK